MRAQAATRAERRVDAHGAIARIAADGGASNLANALLAARADVRIDDERGCGLDELDARALEDERRGTFEVDCLLRGRDCLAGACSKTENGYRRDITLKQYPLQAVGFRQPVFFSTCVFSQCVVV